MEPIQHTNKLRSRVLVTGGAGFIGGNFIYHLLAETQAEVDRLTNELEETRQAFAAPAATIDSLRAQNEDLQSRLDSSEANAAELAEENSELRENQAQNRMLVPLQWVGGVALACLVGGLLFGFWWTDYRSRKRHGGIRIY